MSKKLEEGKVYLMDDKLSAPNPFRVVVLEVSRKAYRLEYDSGSKSWVDQGKFHRDHEVYEELGTRDLISENPLIMEIAVEFAAYADNIQALDNFVFMSKAAQVGAFHNFWQERKAK